MKYSRLLFFVLLIFLSGKEVWCQKIFREGFIVKKNGEVLHGLVEYSSDERVPAKCTFKRFDIAREVKYTPEQLNSFGYKNGNKYDSKEFNNKILFYEVIVSGKINLYKKGSVYYIEKDHNGIVQLSNGAITYVDIKGKTDYKSLSEFLNYITEGKSGTIPNNFSLKADITQLIISFDKNSGSDFYVFNRSMSEKQIIRRSLETGINKNRYGLVWGLNLYKFNLTSARNNTDFLPDPKPQPGMVFGLTYEKLLSRRSDRFSLKLDLLYNRHSFYYYKQDITGSVFINRNDAYINFTGIKVPVLFQYSLTGGKIVPFMNTGLAYQFIITKNYVQISEVESISTHIIRTYEYKNMDFHFGEISAVAGIGVRTRILNNINLNIQGRFEVGPGSFYKVDENLSFSEKASKYNPVQATFLVGITF